MNIGETLKLSAPLLALVAGAALVKSSIYSVDGGHRAIKFSRFFGVLPNCYREGWHLRIPYFERPIIYETRVKYDNIIATTGSKDLQTIDLNIRLIYKPMEDKLPELYRLAGTDFYNRVMPSLINEIARIVVARYNAFQLMNQREQVSQEIKVMLKKRAQKFYIDIDDVSIVHLTYSQDFNTAVEAKQAAQQDAERAKYLVEQAIQDKKSTIIRAQGEAISAELIGKAMNPAYLELKRVDAARHIAEIMAISSNRAFIDSDTLLLNIAGPLGYKLISLNETK